MSSRVRAAGGVVWRLDGAQPAVAVVHRPRYDDWSLPKGKQRTGEHLVATAQREVTEETGQLTTMGRSLGSSRYVVLVKGVRTPKLVVWWSMESTGEQPRVGSEVDEVRWVSPDEAARLLTHRHEVEVVQRFSAGPPRTPLVLLVRHARAGRRQDWTGDDEVRPLDATGHEQARALTDVLTAFAPSLILTAPPLRCVQTVLPLADRLGLPVRVEPLLGDDAHLQNGAASAALVRRQTVAPASVLCSQGGLIRDVVAALTEGQEDRPAAGKGSAWVLSLEGERLLSAAHLSSPR